MALRYLLEAVFSDGTSLSQNPDDVSTIDPTRSWRYDLQEMTQNRKLVAVVLRGERQAVGVDLETGFFCINGGPHFLPGDPLPKGFRWVPGLREHGPYFRVTNFEARMTNDGPKMSSDPFLYCIGVNATPGIPNFLGVE